MTVEKYMMFRDAPAVVDYYSFYNDLETCTRAYKVTFELRIVGRSASK